MAGFGAPQATHFADQVLTPWDLQIGLQTAAPPIAAAAAEHAGPGLAGCVAQLSGLSLEAYAELHSLLTKDTGTVQPVLTLEKACYKMSDLKQVPDLQKGQVPILAHSGIVVHCAGGGTPRLPRHEEGHQAGTHINPGPALDASM